ENDAVVGCEIVNGNEAILVVCENGFGKKSAVDEFRKTHRGGVGVRSIITNDRNGAVAGALVVTDNDNLLIVSQAGQTVRIDLSDVRVMGRNTQGVKLANLKDDTIVAIQKVPCETPEEAAQAALASGEAVLGDVVAPEESLPEATTDEQ
ncbi:MAG TPA: DNA gyrase C-terminal beta-propeller domain-containing protein, partial [Chlamydiales bacterium]|nr:DNA gyrase C-terminal beta-propeller domain-containing protein [Chlamydiales bacterium]